MIHSYTRTSKRPEYQSKTQHKERLLSAVFIAKTKVAIIYVSVDGYFILLRKTSRNIPNRQNTTKYQNLDKIWYPDS
jgi:hypothetical protein